MSNHHVFIADKISDAGRDFFVSEKAFSSEYAPGLDRDKKKAVIAKAHGLIVRSSTKVDRDLLSSAPDLRLVIRAGIGVDNIDIPACTERGIVVENTPFGNAVSAAEHALALLFALAREIPQAYATMSRGGWGKKKFMGIELEGKTLGVIGAGNIGRILIRKARGIGMNVIAFDPSLTDADTASLQITKVDLEKLFATADAISLHVPLTDRTRGMIGSDAFSKMKKGMLLVNAARGGVVDEAALLDALNEGGVRAAALDVFAEEPLSGESPLRGRPDVILTPHLGASTQDAQDRVAIQAAQQMAAFFRDGTLKNALNKVG